jgi:hypothetical protein
LAEPASFAFKPHNLYDGQNENPKTWDFEHEDEPESSVVGNRGRGVTGISGHGEDSAALPRRVIHRVYSERFAKVCRAPRI